MKTIRNIAISVVATVLILAFVVRAQSPMFLLSAPAGSTLANCGTPTTPSVCGVSTGVYVWQNATQGWFLLAPPASGVTSVTVCNAIGTACGTPITGPVSLNIPKTVVVSAPTATVTAPAATLQ